MQFDFVYAIPPGYLPTAIHKNGSVTPQLAPLYDVALYLIVPRLPTYALATPEVTPIIATGTKKLLKDIGSVMSVQFVVGRVLHLPPWLASKCNPHYGSVDGCVCISAIERCQIITNKTC